MVIQSKAETYGKVAQLVASQEQKELGQSPRIRDHGPDTGHQGHGPWCTSAPPLNSPFSCKFINGPTNLLMTLVPSQSSHLSMSLWVQSSWYSRLASTIILMNFNFSCCMHSYLHSWQNVAHLHLWKVFHEHLPVIQPCRQPLPGTLGDFST